MDLPLAVTLRNFSGSTPPTAAYKAGLSQVPPSGSDIDMNSAATIGIDPLFHEPVELLSTDARVALSYKRARLLMHEYGGCNFLCGHPIIGGQLTDFLR